MVYNGVCARYRGRYYHSNSFAAFLRDLTSEFERVRYFGAFLDEGDRGFEHTCEAPLGAPNLELHLVRGNSGSTGAWAFVRNYIVALWRLAGFLRGSQQVVAFVPSFLSVAAALGALALDKKLGVYIGGNWSQESQHRRLTPIQRVFYPVNRYAIDPLVRWVARRAQFVVTPGYDAHARLRERVRNIMLPAPLLGVRATDVVGRTDTCGGAEIRVLFVGALRVQKGVGELLEAFARVRGRIADKRLVLWFVGSGEAEPTLRERAAQLELAGVVRFFGHIENGPSLFDVYRQADIFALPTYSEGFPRSLYEAMTFGLPVLTTSVGGIPYFLEHLRHAVLIQPGDVVGLEAALFSLLTDAALRSRLVHHARDLMLDVVYPRIERDQSLAKQISRGFVNGAGAFT